MAMSASFSVQASGGAYAVRLEAGLLESAEMRAMLANSSIVADAFFRTRQFPAGTLFVEATEGEKSLDRMPGLIERLRAGGVHRGSRLAAVGGGVIQDLCAFVASIYMRGIDWTYVPTTVLAMVDSCIGGKSSINVGPYKNLVGTFHPPARILIDPSLAATLPRAQYAGGLIEAAKICFCRGEAAFAEYLAAGPAVGMPADQLEAVVKTSLEAKKWFIETDEFDRKERLLLNFGHTFGHGIEGASGYGVPHGIAVGMGVLCALALQRSRGVAVDGAGMVGALSKHLQAMIGAQDDLGDQLLRMDVEQVLERFGSDKKHSADSFTLVLVDGSGQVVLERMPRGEAVMAELRGAIESTFEMLMP